jgi:hypothetical protein
MVSKQENGQAITRLRQETYTTRQAAEARRDELNAHRHSAHTTDPSEQRRRGARSLDDDYAADWIAAQRIKVANGQLKARTLDEYAKLFDLQSRGLLTLVSRLRILPGPPRTRRRVLLAQPKRSTSRPWRRPRSLTVSAR